MTILEAIVAFRRERRHVAMICDDPVLAAKYSRVNEYVTEGSGAPTREPIIYGMSMLMYYAFTHYTLTLTYSFNHSLYTYDSRVWMCVCMFTMYVSLTRRGHHRILSGPTQKPRVRFLQAVNEWHWQQGQYQATRLFHHYWRYIRRSTQQWPDQRHKCSCTPSW